MRTTLIFSFGLVVLVASITGVEILNTAAPGLFEMIGCIFVVAALFFTLMGFAMSWGRL